jgi:hypothetical protein
MRISTASLHSTIDMPYGHTMWRGIVHARRGQSALVFFLHGHGTPLEVRDTDGDVTRVGGIGAASAALRTAYHEWAARDALSVAAADAAPAAGEAGDAPLSTPMKPRPSRAVRKRRPGDAGFSFHPAETEAKVRFVVVFFA